jgi:NADPH-dependent 2,4-dienoyl-CoA reductase/sulfur reductase-like enzyme
MVRRASAGTRAVVLGTGFIGCEIAASLAKRGVKTTLVGQETLPQAERLGHEAAQRIAAWLRELEVELVMDTEVCGLTDGKAVQLKDGARLEGDYVVLGMGARPRVTLASDAGLDLEDGLITVDCRMKACDKLFAVGDIAYAHNVSAGRHLRVEHWGDALEHGNVAGSVLAGEDACWKDVPGFWSTIAEHTLKYASWGDGHDRCELVEHPDGNFTIWYSRQGTLVGVLTCGRDEDYERGREMVKRAEPAQ